MNERDGITNGMKQRGPGAYTTRRHFFITTVAAAAGLPLLNSGTTPNVANPPGFGPVTTIAFQPWPSRGLLPMCNNAGSELSAGFKTLIQARCATFELMTSAKVDDFLIRGEQHGRSSNCRETPSWVWSSTRAIRS
jgi:hypothetical protein